MLFRKTDGTLIEINRKDFKNDFNYYKKIMITKSFSLDFNLSFEEDKNYNSYTKKILTCFLKDALNDSDDQEEYKE
jgi:uncharacterized protein YktA (UPF0223 family)